VDKTIDSFRLISKNKEGYTKYVSEKKIKDYIVTNSTLSTKKVRAEFSNYINLYKQVYNVEVVPSRFKYKSVIILEKKEFEDEIKNQTFTKLDILKAIPIRWISKNGTESWNHIPIEPMI